VADGLRKCSGHDEHHVTLYTYVTLYISKSRPALAGVVDRAPPPMGGRLPQSQDKLGLGTRFSFSTYFENIALRHCLLCTLSCYTFLNAINECKTG
jgi:hypothetical protein